MSSNGSGWHGVRHWPTSDPSGDGHGPVTLDESRAELTNVGQQGDAEATGELIDSLLY